MSAVPRDDLEHILGHTRELWDEVRDSNILITGGTGFFGCWLLESLLWANTSLDLRASAFVLTRNPEAFLAKAPHLADHPNIRLVKGDVRTMPPLGREFPFAIHAATEASEKLADEDPFTMYTTIVDGTRRILEFARQSGARKLLLTSSGAVYGKQPCQISHVEEDYTGAPVPNDPRAVYGEGKRCAELLCSMYSSAYGIECKIARCFAFVGPHLPLDRHYAIGNFIRDAMAGRPIRVNGDGTPYRSYLYVADLAIWLWTILFKGESCRPYNVGSEDAVSIAELAAAVSNVLNPALPVDIAKTAEPGRLPQRYVPSTRRAREELGLQEHIHLRDAIRRTAAWHGFSR
jgi:dTDP-glucose 4,6-dehydratase